MQLYSPRESPVIFRFNKSSVISHCLVTSRCRNITPITSLKTLIEVIIGAMAKTDPSDQSHFLLEPIDARISPSPHSIAPRESTAHAVSQMSSPSSNDEQLT